MPSAADASFSSDWRFTPLLPIGCTFAPTFATLLLFRAFQGASVGVGVIVGRAVIRDLYDGPQAQKLLSLVTMIFGFAPAVAPVIGGWIHVTFRVAWGVWIHGMFRSGPVGRELLEDARDPPS